MAAVPRQAFAASAERPAALIERLRRTLGAAEASTGLAGEDGALLALGIPSIDGALGGGLSCGTLHEIAAARETETTAATGFALALALAACRPLSLRGAARARNDERVVPGRNVVWIAEDLSLAENGVPYGPGLDEAGIAPEQLIRVATARGRDVLWAMEEALRCRAVGVAIGEMRARSIDQVATRRLSLAAAAGDTLGLILRTTPDEEPSTAATRWITSAARADEPDSRRVSPARLQHKPAKTGVFALMSSTRSARAAIGPPRLAVRLVRNRRGHLGAWIVEWNSVEQRFELATHSEPVAGAAFDRPHRTAVA